MTNPLSLIEVETNDISYLFRKNIHVSVLRLDKIHPQISGNKWFKLHTYLREAARLGKSHLVTFGGAWSNHIAATAALSKMQGFPCTGIIRGEEPAQLSATLLTAIENGMKLVFISRTDYSNKKLPDEFNADDYYMIPEGGYGPLGAMGAGTILDYCKNKFSHYCCSVGTGTMMAGIINALSLSERVTGISVLKNNYELVHDISKLLLNDRATGANWELLHDYHFGGYGKINDELIVFMNKFFADTNIPSDLVYTGKLFYAITDLIERGYYPEQSRLLLIHSGGLQGNASLSKGTLIF